MYKIGDEFFMDRQNEIIFNARTALEELLSEANMKPGDLLVVGCSSSEICGGQIGHASSPEIGKAVAEELLAVCREHDICLAAQCCEHLNRALIVERQAAVRDRLTVVNAVPKPKAGGSFACMAYESFRDPVAVEHIRAQAGIDIGDTLIGMHLQDVAVPVRINQKQIGNAHVVCARTRPKFVGGQRAVYDDKLL